MTSDSTTQPDDISVSNREYIAMVRDEYWKTRDRAFQLSDSIQNDFRLFGIGGPLLLGGGTILGASVLGKNPDVHIGEVGFPLMILFFVILAVYAVLSFRDYARAVLVEHSLYVVWQNERRLCRLLREHGYGNPEESFRVARDWVEKFQRKYAYFTGIFSLMFGLPILLVPPVVLLSTQGAPCVYGWSYLAVACALNVCYLWIGQRSFSRFTTLFDDLTEAPEA